MQETKLTGGRRGSDTRSVNSPEFRKEMLDELKDWAAKGHCKVSEFDIREANCGGPPPDLRSTFSRPNDQRS